MREKYGANAAAAAKRRKNTAHAVSRGYKRCDRTSPEGAKEKRGHAEI
jgi:hypothetical protein